MIWFYLFFIRYTRKTVEIRFIHLHCKYSQILPVNLIPNSHWTQTQSFLQLMVSRFPIAIHDQREEVIATIWRWKITTKMWGKKENDGVKSVD